jgi:hypothetical protein
MKSVPNLISYLQEFSQIFPHIVSIFLVQKAILGISEKEKALTCGPRLSATKPPRAAPGLAAPVPSRPCLKGVVPTALHRSAVSRVRAAPACLPCPSRPALTPPIRGLARLVAVPTASSRQRRAHVYILHAIVMA